MKRKLNAGFTLIELMIVVAIIGVLAVLAIYGVTKYLRTAKTAEATNSIGAINRGAVAAYDKESAPPELLGAGGTSALTTHVLCITAPSPVPATLVGGVKYQASSAAGADYNAGSATTGFPCVRFEMTEPQYYQYDYTAGASPTIALNADLVKPVGAAWWSEAVGDLDANTTLSNFVTGGGIDATTQRATVFTQISVSNETE